jgi:hypothetical protein
MLIQAAQTMSFSNTAEEKTVVLKATQSYSGIRIAVKHTVTATGELTAGPILDLVTKLVVDVPEYGSNSRRVDLDDNTIHLLPLICQLGAVGDADAASATSCDSTTGGDAVAGFAYFDIPVNKLNLDEDTRVTIKAASSGAANQLDVSFALLDHATRNVYFRAYSHAAGTTSVQQWFPSDGSLVGAVVGSYQTLEAGTVFDARNGDNISRISLDGEQASTYSNPEILAAGADEIISGGGVADESFAAKDVYAMLRNFPAKAGARYVQTDRNESCGLLIVGVMTDA